VKVCADRQETLLLDVHGELPASERPAWRRHLDICPGCRRERQDLARVLDGVREAFPSPALSPQYARALRGRVTRSWRAYRARAWWQGLFFGMRLRPVPALAAVGLLLAVVGWFGLHELRTAHHTLPAPEAPKQIIVSDAEVIENLDLLEHMDDIEKVVKLVDHRDIVL
jgi:anti-sigma factor RsiW